MPETAGIATNHLQEDSQMALEQQSRRQVEDIFTKEKKIIDPWKNIFPEIREILGSLAENYIFFFFARKVIDGVNQQLTRFPSSHKSAWFIHLR